MAGPKGDPATTYEGGLDMSKSSSSNRTVYFDEPPESFDANSRDFRLAQEAATTAQDGCDVPEHLQVQMRVATDYPTQMITGIMYQKCGGGRRVIRKRIGGN